MFENECLHILCYQVLAQLSSLLKRCRDVLDEPHMGLAHVDIWPSGPSRPQVERCGVGENGGKRGELSESRNAVDNQWFMSVQSKGSRTPQPDTGKAERSYLNPDSRHGVE